MNIVIRVQARQAQAALKATRSAMKDLDGAQVSGARSSNVLSASMAAGASHMTRMGNRLQWTGRQLMYNWTLPITAAATAMSKWQLDNEKAMTRVQKVYGDADFSNTDKKLQRTKNELGSLQKAFVALSNQYGVTQADVINIGADWAAAGSSGLALAKDTELTLKAMVLGEMDYEKATKSLISIQAQYQLTSDGLADTLAQLNIVENQTGTSMDDLIEAFTRTAGVARNAGVSTGELSAMIAAIVPAAGSAANGGNALKTIFSRLLAPTNEAREVLAKMNINVADAGWQSKTAAERLQVLAEKYVKLSGGQRAAVSSTVASRWQLNKFDILMEAMVKNHSYYQSALKATSDSTKYFRVANQELTKVLDSNPQRIKQIGVILQNVAAQVITPFIPMIVGMANELRKLGDWFAALDPRIQKTIGYVLLFIAVIGPVAKYVGSIGTLLGTLGSAFSIFGTGVLRAAGMLKVLLFLPFAQVSKGITGIVGSVGGLIARFGGLRAIWGAVATQIVGRLIGIKMIFGAVFTYFIRSCLMMPATLGGMWAGIVAGANVAAYGVGTAFSNVGKGILVGLVSGLKALPMLLFRFLIGPWGIALSAVVGIIVIFRKQLGQVFSRLGAALISPWTDAMSGFNGIADFFSKFVQFLKNVFWSLPVEVQRAMMAVVQVVESAAMAVYKLFSYLNPFAHHSPSLVENVTKGMAVVVNQFGTLSKIKGSIDTAYANIKKLKDLTADFNTSYAASEQNDQIKNLAKYAPQAVAVYRQLGKEVNQLQIQLDRLAGPIQKQKQAVAALSQTLDDLNFKLDQQQKILDSLQDTADGYASKIDAAQTSLSNFANAPLKGLSDMEDKIFDNEQAQKKLQLQMLKIKQAGGGFDDLSAKIAALNGAMETLQADKASARAGGAGSEITSFYDDEMAKLEKQKKAIGGQADEYAKLGKQLDELAAKGERLDLEKSLNFDGVQRQIEKLASTQKELTFSQIATGIAAAKAEMGKYQPKLDAANAAVARQKAVVDRMAAAIRPIQDEYDVQNHKLELMNDAYNRVNDTIQDINSAMSDISQKADSTASKAMDAADKAARKKKKGSKADSQSPGAQAFDDAKGTGFKIPGGKGNGPSREGKEFDQSKLIDQFTQDIAKKTGGMWSSIDLLGPIKKKWDAVKGWFSKNIQPAFKPIKDYVVSLFDGIDWLAPFKKGSAIGGFVDKIIAAFKKIPDYLQDAWLFIKTIFGDDFKHLFTDTWSAIKDATADLMPTLKPLFQSLKGFIPMIKTGLVVAFVVLVAAIKLVVMILKAVLPPVIRLVGTIFKGMVKIITGVVKVITGLFNGDFRKALSGLKDIFRGAFEILFGIIRAAFAVVYNLIGGGIDWFLSLIAAGATAMFGPDSKWAKAFVDARDYVSDLVRDIGKYFGGLWKSMGDWVSKAYDAVIGWFAKMYDEIIGHSIVPDLVNGVVDWFKKLPGRLLTWMKETYHKVTGKFADIWNWVKDKFAKWWSGVKKIFTDPVGSAYRIIGEIKEKIRGVFNSLWDWFKNTWIGKRWNTVKTLFTHPVESARAGIAIVKDKIHDIFNSLWDWFKDTWIGKRWNTIKEKLTKPIKDAKDYLSDVLTGKKSIRQVFEDAIRGFGVIWDKLADKAKKPIRFIVTEVINGGFIKTFNDFGSHLPGKPHLDNMALPKGFMRGGSTGPGAKNKAAGIVHADEHVWTKAEVHKVPGGHRTLEKMRAAVRSNKAVEGMPGYSVGGKVQGGSITNPDAKVSVDGKSVSKIAALQLALAQTVSGIKFRVMQGGYGGGHVAASGTSHNYPGVVDVAPATVASEKVLRQVAFAAWARNIPGRTSVGSGAHVHAASLIDPGNASAPQITGSWPGHGNGISGRNNDPAPHYAWLPNLLERLGASNLSTLGGGGGIDYAGVFNGMFDKVKEQFSKLGGLFSNDSDIITKTVSGAAHQLPSAILALAKEKVEGAIKSMIGSVKGAFSTVVNGGSNRAIGKAMMKQGWPDNQWSSLNKLWTRESGWRTNAKNPSSGAYGIPQALPGNKMASAGSDWSDNPKTQIKWGLGYIRNRYATPDKAWAHSQKTGWYAKGTASSVRGMAWVGENGPELMSMSAGRKVYSNTKSSSKLASSIEMTVTRAVTSGMSSAMRPIERSTVVAMSRAVARGERRVASGTDKPREAVSVGSARTVVIQEAVFPNVSDANDAKNFIENLVLVTSGIGGSN